LADIIKHPLLPKPEKLLDDKSYVGNSDEVVSVQEHREQRNEEENVDADK